MKFEDTHKMEEQITLRCLRFIACFRSCNRFILEVNHIFCYTRELEKEAIGPRNLFDYRGNSNGVL